MYCCIINVECGDLGGHGPPLSPHSLLGWGTGLWALLPSAPQGEGWRPGPGSGCFRHFLSLLYATANVPGRTSRLLWMLLLCRCRRPGSSRASYAGAAPRRRWALEEAPGVGGGLRAAGGLPPPRRTSLWLLLAVSGRLLYDMQLLFRMRPGFGSGRGSQTPLLGPCLEQHPGRQIEAATEASERSHWKMHCRGRRLVRLGWSRDEVLAHGARSLLPRPR